MQRSLAVVKFLTTRYARSEAFFGISLMNEPGRSIDKVAVSNYYKASYKTVRALLLFGAAREDKG